MKLHLSLVVLAIALSVCLAKPSGKKDGKVFNKANAIKHFLRSIRPKTPTANTLHTKNPITASIVIQKSKDLVSSLLKMQQVAPEIKKRLDEIDGKDRWIDYYTYWQFDDKNYYYVTKTPFSDAIETEIEYAIEERRSAPLICQNLKTIDTLIDVLSDPDATPNMEVFVYVYGGSEVDDAQVTQLKSLIDKLQAKIHITQNSLSANCFNQDFNDPQLTVLADIAQYSGGMYSLSGDGASLLALPFQHDSTTILIEKRRACQDVQEYKFAVNDSPYTLSFLIYGDIKNDPNLTGPNGATYKLNAIYKSTVDRLYYVDIDEPVSGEFTLTHEVYESSDPLECVESFIFTAEEQRCEFGSMPGTEREFMNNAYLERKNLVFGCKLTHLNPDPYLCVLSFKDSLVQKIKNAYKTGLHFDTTIEAEGKEFKVSRFILCAHSQIFRNMFSENYNENTNGKVKIDDITAQTMEAFLKWMHTGEILNENIVEELFVVADKYMVADLKSICSKIMVATLTETNAMQRLIIASKHNDNELEWKITGFIASKQPVFIHNIYQSKAWFEYLKLQHED
ncbi:Protein roadkill [Aphelenchoides bicaudatus]|nr:Protein roadkill [Aphelenchoides bicaudatus]